MKIISVFFAFCILLQAAIGARLYADYRVQENNTIRLYGDMDNLDFSDEHPNLKILLIYSSIQSSTLFSSINHDMGISKNKQLKVIR